MIYLNLTDLEKETLMEGYKNHPKSSTRCRFQAILLSAEGRQVKDIAAIFTVRTRTIYSWMNNWQKRGIVGLLTRPGQGRPPVLSIDDEELIKVVKKKPVNMPEASNKCAMP